MGSSLKRTRAISHSRRPAGLDPYERAAVDQHTDPREKHLIGVPQQRSRDPVQNEKLLPGDLAKVIRNPVPTRRSSDDMSKAPQFYGKPGQLEPVLTYCLVKSLADTTITDQAKCGTLASLFRGPALSWLTSTLESTPKLLNDYEEFVDTLKSEFGVTDTAKQHQAAKALRNLNQKGSAQLYAIQLEQYCKVLGHSDATQLTYFLEGLKLHVREALITKGAENRTYNQAKAEAIRIDTELYNARRRGAGRTGQGQAEKSHSGGIKCHKCGRFGHKKNQCKSTGGEQF